MHTETVVAVVLTANAALCALVPVEVKARQPLLWKVLDALELGSPKCKICGLNSSAYYGDTHATSAGIKGNNQKVSRRLSQ